MSHFNFTKQRACSQRSMELERRAVRQDYLPEGVGNAAVLALGEALVGWIVGLDEREVRPIVERSRDWLVDSLARDERFGDSPESFAAVRMEALAIASWALGEPSQAHYRRAVELQDRAHAVLRLSDVALRDNYLEDYLVDCVLAGEYQRGADACTRCDVEVPGSESEVTTPLSLAAWISGARAADPALDPTSQPPDPQIAARILKGPFAQWLTRGDGMTAAAWSQLIFCAGAPEPDAAFRAARHLVVER